MSGLRLHPDWPTRQIQLAVDGVNLSLRAPDNPYALLDLPSVEEAFEQDEYMPYWAHLWPAGMMLAAWLVRRVKAAAELAVRRSSPQRPRSRTESAAAAPPVPLPPARLLEIGCGLAVPGLLAARLGYRVTLTDYDPDALEYVRQNAELNRIKAAAAALDWRAPPTDRYPIILGGDVLYEQRNHQPIFEFLRLSLETTGLAALADPNRHLADVFIHAAPAAGWQVQAEPAHWEDTPGRVILLRRK